VNWPRALWLIAARYGFPPGDIMEMEIPDLFFWLEGVAWLNKPQGS
jgi:hypothetical protein